MLRNLVLKSSFGAAAAAAVSQVSQPSHANVRALAPTVTTRATKDSQTSAPLTEDAWLAVDMRENELTFTPAEINEVVEEIQNLTVNDEDEKTDEADRAIDNSNVIPRSSLGDMVRASQIMLENPGVQNACLNAVAGNAELQEIMGNLTDSTILPAVPAMIENAPAQALSSHRVRGNAIKTLLEDVAYQFRVLLSGAKDSLTVIGRIIAKVGKALWDNLANPAGEVNKLLQDPSKSDFDKVSGLVLRLATFIMVVLIAKRLLVK